MDKCMKPNKRDQKGRKKLKKREKHETGNVEN